jgi:hypothetical protein
VVGVLLLWAVAEFAGGKPVRATALATGATLVHSTYLLPAAMLVGGFLVQLLWEKNWKAAGWSAVVAVLFVAPAVAYILIVFAPTDAATFTESQRILAEIRIPHHCRPARWFDWAGGVQVAWMVLGLVLLRKTRLFVPLAVVSGLVLVGTVAVIVTANPTLSLLFPWRVTAVLVPVSTTIVLATATTQADKLSWRFTAQGLDEMGGSPIVTGVMMAIAFAVLVFGSVGGVYGGELGYREPENETPLLAHVGGTRTADHVYLIPAKFPAPSKNFTGVYSKTFSTPDPTFSDLARFRLKTHARLYVDFKAIPYHDIDVIEWHRRVSHCQRWYASADWDATGIINEVAAEGVTHVIAPAGKPIRSSRLEVEFETPTHRLYRVR